MKSKGMRIPASALSLREQEKRQRIERIERLEPIDSSWSVAQHCRKEAA